MEAIVESFTSFILGAKIFFPYTINIVLQMAAGWWTLKQPSSSVSQPAISTVVLLVGNMHHLLILANMEKLN